jgi:transmembrane sensor
LGGSVVFYLMIDQNFDPDMIERRAAEVLAARVESRDERWDVDGQLARVMDRSASQLQMRGVGLATRTDANVGGFSGGSLRGWVGYPIAAAAALIITTLGIKHIPNITPKVTPQSKTYTTALGQRATINLNDGTTAILAPSTTMRVTGRNVDLTGHALFTVTHAAGTPFVVKTGNVATRVLGTSFSIRRYESDTIVQVVVAQGRVSVGSAILGTGDVALASRADKVTVIHGTNVSPQLAWAEGRLVFADTPFRDVIPELERWYGIAISVSDRSLLNRPVVTTLDTETASRAIELVAFAIGARAELKGGRASFYLKGD